MTWAPSRFTSLLLLAASLACESRARSESPPRSEEPAPSHSAPRPASRQFGAPFTGNGPVLSLADVLADPERFRDQTVLVEGEVRSACTRRGCWMEVAPSIDPKQPGCRVTFKDYGFFVPTDSAGARAKVQGILGVNTLAPERVAHLESEGGHFPRKKADGSVDELRLVATGVELWR